MPAAFSENDIDSLLTHKRLELHASTVRAAKTGVRPSKRSQLHKGAAKAGSVAIAGHSEAVVPTLARAALSSQYPEPSSPSVPSVPLTATAEPPTGSRESVEWTSEVSSEAGKLGPQQKAGGQARRHVM